MKAAKSDETTDLAKSAIAEFNDIAEEVRLRGPDDDAVILACEYDYPNAPGMNK